VDGGIFIPVTPPTATLTVDKFTVFVDGAFAAPGTQPRAIIYLQAHSGTRGGRTDYNLETVVSQRKLNN
jgi:hypothetical protein